VNIFIKFGTFCVGVTIHVYGTIHEYDTMHQKIKFSSFYPKCLLWLLSLIVSMFWSLFLNSASKWVFMGYYWFWINFIQIPTICPSVSLDSFSLKYFSSSSVLNDDITEYLWPVVQRWTGVEMNMTDWLISLARSAKMYRCLDEHDQLMNIFGL